MHRGYRRPLVALLFALAPLLAEDHLKFGQPACSSPVLDKKFFAVCHDPDRKVPVWVGYALTHADLAAAVADRREGGFRFRPDPEIPRGQRAEMADYTNSGFDKGHMAPAADFKRSVEAMKATFILSNAVPQKHGVNGGLWSRLEAAVRGIADSRGSVWVFSGPVYGGGKPMKTIGPHHVSVPTHTFKVILCVRQSGEKEMFGFILPNIDKPKGQMTDYAFSVRDVEKLVELDFFSTLPRREQDRLERGARALPGQ